MCGFHYELLRMTSTELTIILRIVLVSFKIDFERLVVHQDNN